jgi:hypothetical protein
VEGIQVYWKQLEELRWFDQTRRFRLLSYDVVGILPGFVGAIARGRWVLIFRGGR